MKMTGYALALTAALTCVPMAGDLVAADATKSDGAKEEAKSAEAKPKPKKKVAKKPFYAAAAEALKVADLSQSPILAVFIPSDNVEFSQVFKRKIMGRPEFKEFALKNLVVYWPKFKKDPKDATKVMTKPIKPADKELMDKFAVSEEMISEAKANGKQEPTSADYKVYPTIVMLSPSADKVLFRMPKYDAEGGFGVWLLEISERMKEAGIEMQIPASVKKILEHPMDEANKAQSKGGKKKK